MNGFVTNIVTPRPVRNARQQPYIVSEAGIHTNLGLIDWNGVDAARRFNPELYELLRGKAALLPAMQAGTRGLPSDYEAHPSTGVRPALGKYTTNQTYDDSKPQLTNRDTYADAGLDAARKSARAAAASTLSVVPSPNNPARTDDHDKAVKLSLVGLHRLNKGNPQSAARAFAGAAKAHDDLAHTARINGDVAKAKEHDAASDLARKAARDCAGAVTANVRGNRGEELAAPPPTIDYKQLSAERDSRNAGRTGLGAAFPDPNEVIDDPDTDAQQQELTEIQSVGGYGQGVPTKSPDEMLAYLLSGDALNDYNRRLRGTDSPAAAPGYPFGYADASANAPPAETYNVRGGVIANSIEGEPIAPQPGPTEILAAEARSKLPPAIAANATVNGLPVNGVPVANAHGGENQPPSVVETVARERQAEIAADHARRREQAVKCGYKPELFKP